MADKKFTVEFDDDVFWLNIEYVGNCWLWRGSRKPNGYGRINVGGFSTEAYTFAYRYLVGPIPQGMEIDHICRNRDCVNPKHLEPVTHQENVARAHNRPHLLWTCLEKW